MATKKNVKKKTAEVSFDTVKTLNANDVVNEIGTLQVGIQQQLANISAAITGKLEQLHNTENAIHAMEDRLNEIYNIEKEVLSLEEVKAMRAEEDEKFGKYVAARHQEWMDEQMERNKKWQREEESHNYEVALQKKKFADEFNAEVAAHKRAEKVRTDELLNDWNKRESELKAHENEFVDLQNKVASFDDRLKAEVSKAEKIAADCVKRSYEHQMQLLQKDQESEQAISEAQIKSYGLTISQLQNQIADLNNQLIAARSDAKEVTSQALQSASGRQVADALQRVVDAKDNTKTK